MPWQNKSGNFTRWSAHQYAYGSDTKTHKKPDTELFYFQTQVVTLRYLNMGISTEFRNRWAVGKGTDLIRKHSSVDSQFWHISGRPVWPVGPPVRPVCSVVIRVGFVLFYKFLYKPTWRGVRLPWSTNIKAKADWGIPNRIKSKYRIIFCLSKPSLFQL